MGRMCVQAAVEELELPCAPTLVISNPPWGQRLEAGGRADRGRRPEGGRGGGLDASLVQVRARLPGMSGAA